MSRLTATLGCATILEMLVKSTTYTWLADSGTGIATGDLRRRLCPPGRIRCQCAPARRGRGQANPQRGACPGPRTRQGLGDCGGALPGGLGRRIRAPLKSPESLAKSAEGHSILCLMPSPARVRFQSTPSRFWGWAGNGTPRTIPGHDIAPSIRGMPWWTWAQRPRVEAGQGGG